MFRYLNKRDTYRYCDPKFFSMVMKMEYIRCSSSRCKSYYSSLGLDSSASHKDIKSAYYDLSFKFHPDKNKGSAESVEKFREITEAYETLSNPEKKKVYDENLNSYSRSEYNPDFQRSTFGRSNFRSHRPPFTGRTNEFNYDEHFRQHYQEYMRQKEAEHEYFRRRWEAEFYRRYPDARTYYREGYARRKNDEDSRPQPRVRSNFYMLLFALWVPILIFQLIIDLTNMNNPKPEFSPLYYKVDG
ncbi:Chaperone protein DnaJ, partial [Stegodyphus mimosarum]